MDDMKPYTTEELKDVKFWKVTYRTQDGKYYQAKTSTPFFSNGLLVQLEKAHINGEMVIADGPPDSGTEIEIEAHFIESVFHPWTT